MAAYQWKLFERDGTAITVDVQPPSDPIFTVPGDVTKLDSLNFDLVGLCKVAEEFCGGRKIVEAQKISSADGYHDAYELRSDGGNSKVSLIARLSNQHTIDLLGQEHCSRQVLSEVAVISLLRHANIPVPRCFSHSTAQSEPSVRDGPPWTLQEKYSGVPLEWDRPGTTKDTKLRMLHEFANISVQLAHFPLTSSAPIGSVLAFDAVSQYVEIGPLYIPGYEVDQKHAVGPFATYQAYISHLVELAEQITVVKPCKELQDYPEWLIDEGIDNRRFAPMCLDGVTCARGWAELAEDAAEYRKIFAESVTALDPGYMKVVDAGSKARQLVDWLLQWRGDDLFVSSFAAWRADVDGPEGV
ncbi:hypothetical protein EWM64_g630 [Hericium alpestre]|uniref:Aminoglycoside phosphotransferase domain-containing protein n=1 Tax=Hericium alpestre TaxID=135208 RepID=A0A4Z0AAN3_9AGAM|nr:hypothetical protein EWM64_g630 [Hericium alpestre]